MTNGPKRTKTQRVQQRLQTAEWYCEGKTQVWIAAKLNLTQGQISQDLKAIRKEWADRSVQTIDAHIAEELAKIDHLEQTYWLAYYESQKPKTRAEVKVIGDQTSIGDRTTETRPEGGAQFLQGVERCIQLRIKLLGLNAPERIALTDWRKEAQEQGINPQDLLDARVNQFKEALLSGTLPIRA